MTRPSNDSLNAAWDLIDHSHLILVVMHTNPDGDALGSGIALTLGLRQQGKEAHLVCPQPTPLIYDFLNPGDIVEPEAPAGVPDLAVVVDCDRADRVGALQGLVNQARKVLVVDHHPPTSDFGDVRLSHDGYAATAEVVRYLLAHRSIPVTGRMAEALMTGLITDTGGFRFSNTRPETFEMAASLARAGASVADISRRVYDSRTLAGLKLLARALASLQSSPAGTVAWARLSADDFAETGAAPEDTEGFVNVVHSLRGTDVAALLREEQPGVVRISLRSRGAAVVSQAAEALGGGGHALAAACVLEASLDDAEERLLQELRKWTAF